MLGPFDRTSHLNLLREQSCSCSSVVGNAFGILSCGTCQMAGRLELLPCSATTAGTIPLSVWFVDQLDVLCARLSEFSPL